MYLCKEEIFLYNKWQNGLANLLQHPLKVVLDISISMQWQSLAGCTSLEWCCVHCYALPCHTTSLIVMGLFVSFGSFVIVSFTTIQWFRKWKNVLSVCHCPCLIHHRELLFLSVQVLSTQQTQPKHSTNWHINGTRWFT